MIDIKAIRVFLEVADKSSFSAAARSLNMTAASVTRIVGKLETDIGHQLLLRTTRKVSLSATGAMVVARYKPVVDELMRIDDEIAQLAGDDHGSLSINAPVSMGMRLLPGLVDGFRSEFPNIKLNIKMTDTLVDIMEEGCDLAIRISRPPTDKSTIWRKICEVPCYAIAAPSLLEQIGSPQTPDDLRTEFCLSYGSDSKAESWNFMKGQQRKQIKAGTTLISNNGDFLYEMVLAGKGIAILPAFFVMRGLQEKQVVRVLPEWDIPSLWLTLYYPPYEQFPPLVATFSKFFETYMRTVDSLDFD